MLFRNWLNEKLQAATAVTDLVSNRIYPVVIPQNQPYPAVAYMVKQSAGGDSKNYSPWIDYYTVTINSWATTIIKAEEIHQAIRDALEAINQETEGDTTVQGAQFQGCEDGIDESNEFFLISATYAFRVQKSPVTYT